MAELGYRLWEAPNATTIVQLSLNVIECLLAEAMTAFGAIPRRGAEIGGILIGCIQGNIVQIEKCEVVPSEHRRGPSYLLSDTDQTAFAVAFERWKPDGQKPAYAVGYFRSNTRDQFATAAEDREIMRQYFPHAPNLMLLIRPYASRPTVGGFVVYEEEALASMPVGEIILRRNEPASAEPRARRNVVAMPRNRARAASAPQNQTEPEISLVHTDVDVELTPADTRNTRAAAPLSQSSGVRRRWPWLASCAVALVIGSVGGFAAAVQMMAQPDSAAPSDPYSLSLAISKSNESVHLRWDRRCQAIRLAQHGALQISDGSYAKTIDLDESQLHNGSVIYYNVTNQAFFRLVVYTRGNNSVSESVEWKQ